jgi:hypothetical protein
VDLYIHSPIRLHGVVFNSLSSGTTLPLYLVLAMAIFELASFMHRGKGPRYPLDRRVSGPHSRSEDCKEKNILPLPGIEPRCFGRLAHSMSLYPYRPGYYILKKTVRQKSHIPRRCITAHHFRILNLVAPFRSNNHYPLPSLRFRHSSHISGPINGPRLLRAFLSACLAYYSAMKTGAVRSSETPLNYRTTWHRIPEDSNLHPISITTTN